MPNSPIRVSYRVIGFTLAINVRDLPDRETRRPEAQYIHKVLGVKSVVERFGFGGFVWPIIDTLVEAHRARHRKPVIRERISSSSFGGDRSKLIVMQNPERDCLLFSPCDGVAISATCAQSWGGRTPDVHFRVTFADPEQGAHAFLRAISTQRPPWLRVINHEYDDTLFVRSRKPNHWVFTTKSLANLGDRAQRLEDHRGRDGYWIKPLRGETLKVYQGCANRRLAFYDNDRLGLSHPNTHVFARVGNLCLAFRRGGVEGQRVEPDRITAFEDA